MFLLREKEIWAAQKSRGIVFVKVSVLQIASCQPHKQDVSQPKRRGNSLGGISPNNMPNPGEFSWNQLNLWAPLKGFSRAFLGISTHNTH